MDSSPSPPVAPLYRPVWNGKQRTIACHMADLDGAAVPNSLEAIQRCVAAGAARVEVDLRFMADDTMAVFHDRFFEPVSTGAGELASHDAASLAAAFYRAGTSVPIARFESAVDALRGSRTMLQVDLRTERMLATGQLQLLADVLRPLNGNCIIGSQAHWNLDPIAGLGLRVAFDPTGHWHYWPGRPAGVAVPPARLGRHGLWDDAPIAHAPGISTRAYIPARVNDLMRIAPAASEWMVDIHTLRYLWKLGYPLGDILHERGIELAAWTIQDRGPATTRARVIELFELGVDTVIADRAATVASYLR